MKELAIQNRIDLLMSRKGRENGKYYKEASEEAQEDSGKQNKMIDKNHS